ncbi:hypothetical protein MTO96_041068 [Rhipicephalus appendiculatus]
MARLFRALRPAFCIVYAVSMANASARRDDGYGESASEENTYRYGAANADGYKHAFNQPSVPALNYLLDISKERITYNRSLVRSRKDETSRHAKEARVLPKTSQRFYTTATVRSWPKLRTRHLRSFQGDISGNAPWSPSASTAEMKGKDTIFRGAYSRTTESWKFGYKGHAAVIIGPRAPDRLRRRESIRYVLPGQNDLTSDTKRRKHSLRRAHRTALCLLVACFVLMAITRLFRRAAQLTASKASPSPSTISGPPKPDCCYQVINTGPWFPLLALCKRSKPVDFLHVMHEDCQATMLSWDEPGSGDVFHVLGRQGDRLVRVLRLRESDIPWHTSRLRVSRELSNLKDSVDNRTSAFFVGAKTSLVRDEYPRLLSNARMRGDDKFLACSATSSQEPELVADYLVTEMQPGWSPLPNYTLTDPEQALSVLGQACWALAVAEAELEFEHRLPSAGAVLVRPTRSPRVEFTLRGHIVRIHSAGLKVRLQGLQLARIRVGTRVELTDFGRFREFVKAEDEVTVCARIADLLSKRPTKFEPLTNVLWLQHLADWLAFQYADAAPVLSHWQGVLAASCSAEHATVGSRRGHSPSGTASP